MNIPAWATEPTAVELDPTDVTEGEIAEHLAALWARDGRPIPLDSDEHARSIFVVGVLTRVYEVTVTDVSETRDSAAGRHVAHFAAAPEAHMREIHPVEAGQYDAGSRSGWGDLHLIAHGLLTTDSECLSSDDR